MAISLISKVLKSLLRPHWRRYKAYVNSRPRPGQNVDWLTQLNALGIAPVSTVLDVGANTGQNISSLRWAFPEARYFLLEPHPDLARNLRSLCADIPRVSVHEVALSQSGGRQRFFMNAYHETSSLLPRSSESEKLDYMTPRGETTVLCQTLEEFCAEHQLSRVDVLKLDTQGNELPILKGAGAALANVRVIYAEITFCSLYDGQSNAWELGRYLETQDFIFFGFYHQIIGENGRLLWGNGMWLNARFFPQVAERKLETFEMKLNEEHAGAVH